MGTSGNKRKFPLVLFVPIRIRASDQPTVKAGRAAALCERTGDMEDCNLNVVNAQSAPRFPSFSGNETSASKRDRHRRSGCRTFHGAADNG